MSCTISSIEENLKIGAFWSFSRVCGGIAIDNSVITDGCDAGGHLAQGARRR